MKRKGVCAEEKIQRILAIFEESGEFFQLKEVEKIAQKQKGINSNLVKDIVNGLVSDGLVDSDKIGASNYYWAFPSKLVNMLERQKVEYVEKIEDLTVKNEEISNIIKKQKERNEGNIELEAKLKELEELKVKKEKIIDEYGKLSEFDCNQIDHIREHCRTLIEMVNFYTDSISVVKQWLRQKFILDETVINKQFGIPSNMDNIYDDND